VIQIQLLIFPRFHKKLKTLKTHQNFIIIGNVYDKFDVIHFRDIKLPSNHDEISFNNNFYKIGFGCFVDNNTKAFECSCSNNGDYTFDYNSKLPMTHLFFAFEKDTNRIVYSAICSNGKLEEINLDKTKVDFDRLFLRIDKKETPLGVLNAKKVAIIGMGSGGSVLATQLAKSGVKNFIFIDNDRLETHNIVRHICSQKDLGRYKTLAVKDYLLNRIPDLEIKTIEENFSLETNKKITFFEELLRDTDLIIAASGEHNVNYQINDFIHSTAVKIPTIFAGTFEKIIGGLMFRVYPKNDDVCYHCVYLDTTDNQKINDTNYPLTKGTDLIVEYDRTLDDKLSQPGLGLDIDNFTIFLAKFALDTLLKDVNHKLYKFSFNFYIWYNRDIYKNSSDELYREGLELYYFEKLEKNMNCPFHGRN
jgi:molybdopterin/thiamine biosynthesis adenylyltransferase